MSPALLCGFILIGTLALFISGRMRPDAVALSALFAALVAAVMVVGRALQMTGIAGWAARVIIPEKAGFTLRLAMLLTGATLLSAFMNHIAALVICMPLATEVAWSRRLRFLSAICELQRFISSDPV